MAAAREEESLPEWDCNELDRQMGQLFVMGFDGTSVDPQIRSLIEDYRLGSIILTAKNLKSAEETTKLVLELQTIARDAGHPAPLMIGLDQENGGVNSLFDEIYIRQFPSAMGIAATGSKSLAREVAKATAQELSAVGVNWILGPVLDVLNNARSQPLGVRSIGDDAQEVSAYGVEFMKGYQEAGLVTCGKHFPSYGNLEVLGNQTDVPVITDTLEQLSMSALVPFRNAIAQGIDSMMVGGCAMSSAGVNVMHACLSEQVVDDLLRKDLNFNGVVVSECLEMEALSFNIGVGGGTVMAMKAGCDLILLCRSFSVQQEAINGLRLGVENGIINKERIRQSVQRVLDMKARCTSWEKALNPAGISLLSQMQPSHTSLSTRAYNSSITIVRDKNNLLPLTSVLEPDEELLLLTPLVKPLPASAVSLSITESSRETVLSTDTVSWERSASVMSGESVFREFGRSLARHRNGRVLHTSYTANGVRPVHENLINRASGVIVVTADSNRNLYQYGFTKHVAMICNAQFAANGDRRSKPLVVVAVSSPYDFATDQSIGTYVCTYDFTETALQALVKVLYGDLTATGVLPGTLSRSQKLHQSRQHWLVENWNEDRDANALDELLTAIREDSTHNQRSALAGVTSNTFLLRNSDVEEAHFVVRNSSTQALYGFCSTYFFKSTGTAVIGALIVDPGRRKLSIGNSLHNRAIRSLMQRQGVRRFQLGSRLPGVYLGIPTGNPVERKRLRQWFASLGWNTSLSRPVCTMILPNLGEWTPPEGLTRTLKSAEVSYDLVYGLDYAEAILDHVKTNSRQGVMEIYKMALSGSSANGIIRAKRNGDDAILGSVVVYTSESTLAEFVPTVKEARPMGGGISSAVISPSAGEYSTIVQGLILLGIKQLRSQGASAVVLDCVDGDGNFDGLSAMGFSTLHSFEEVTCDAATWNMLTSS
ncbi:beta-N-acetylglucosaminidase/beta-glucosidase [Coccidioides immitis RMSCC 2394]|uniref:Beta-N-acetylglucosaminidase/beta-glucosidase n=1 Tax=Coccidioides immitis RMSCC 2394 TaxID=404692 RepID=A0A0J6YBX2_COCIT|nr:beta-N-acetylglucosaminidase/beta-glucosidase [Coccidioides immitis RMSCC 2394]